MNQVPININGDNNNIQLVFNNSEPGKNFEINSEKKDNGLVRKILLSKPALSLAGASLISAFVLGTNSNLFTSKYWQFENVNSNPITHVLSDMGDGYSTMGSEISSLYKEHSPALKKSGSEFYQAALNKAKEVSKDYISL